MITGWPNVALSAGEIIRAMTSVGPPGADGMMIRTGRFAKPPSVVCARAPAARLASARASVARRVIGDMPPSPLVIEPFLHKSIFLFSVRSCCTGRPFSGSAL